LRKATKEEAGLLSKIREYIMDGKIDMAKDYCAHDQIHHQHACLRKELLD
jgi:hypothetical protein